MKEKGKIIALFALSFFIVVVVHDRCKLKM